MSSVTALHPVLVDVFLTHGQVLPIGRIVDGAVAAGMKRATVGVDLSRSPIFKPVSRGRYALRGAIVSSPVLA